MFTCTSVIRDLPIRKIFIPVLLPLPQVKRCFYQLRSGRTNQQLVTDMAGIFQVSKQAMRIRLENHNLL